MNCPDSFTELLPEPAREAPRDGRRRALHNVPRSATSHQLADKGETSSQGGTNWKTFAR